MHYTEAFYEKYPVAFREAIVAIKAAEDAEFDALSTRMRHDFRTSQEQGTLSPDFDEYAPQRGQIRQKYQSLIVEVHDQYNVPFLQSWEKALEATGKAIYHPEYQAHEGQDVQATLLKEGDQTILIFQESYVFPATWTPTEINSYLFSRAVYDPYTWEAISPAQILKAALNNEDGVTALATNEAGVTIQVTYHTATLGGDPFLIWQVASLQEPTPDDINCTFDFEGMCENIFAAYNLDANAAIWTRQATSVVAHQG